MFLSNFPRVPELRHYFIFCSSDQQEVRKWGRCSGIPEIEKRSPQRSILSLQPSDGTSTAGRFAAVRSWNFVSLRLGRRWAVSLWLNEERRKRREIAPCNNSLPTGSLPPPLAVDDSPNKCSLPQVFGRHEIFILRINRSKGRR